MTIDDDVRSIARKWGLDPALIQAIVIAEGGGDHIITAIQCSFPKVTTRKEALEITCRSVAHRMSDYVKLHYSFEFAQYLGSFWAPIGAANDPDHLNEHWVGNVFHNWIQRA